MDWIVALAVTALGLMSLPMVLRRAKSSAAKGAAGGIVMALGMAFTILLDPARKAAIENIEKRKDIGDSAENAAGAPPHKSNTDSPS